MLPQAEIGRLKAKVLGYKRRLGAVKQQFRAEKTRLVEKLEAKVTMMQRMEVQWKQHLDQFEAVMVKAEAARQNAGACTWWCQGGGRRLEACPVWVVAWVACGCAC